MAEFIRRKGVLHKIKEGEPLCPTSEAPQVGDRVLDGHDVFQMQANGVLSKIQTCSSGTDHLLRSKATPEGGRNQPL